MTLLHHKAFNPWSDVDRLFGSLMNEASWTPVFDIEETDAAYVLRGDIPGVPQKEIEVRIENGVLSLQGQRKQSEVGSRFSRRERPHGKFLRRFRLPEEVDADGVKASYADGVLELSLPKREPADSSRLIPVH